MHPFPHGEPITLTKRVATGERDDYGVLQYRTYAVQIPGVAIWPTTSNEVTGGQQNRTDINYTVALPREHQIDATDVITWAGRDYEVIGPPEQLRNPVTGNTVQTFSMSRVEG